MTPDSSPRTRPVRIAFQTLGCPKNTVDSNALSEILRRAGFDCVAQAHRADVLVLNTCGFLDDAKIESVEMLLAAARWKAARPGRRVIAMGCLTARDGAEITAEIPELDGVFGIGEWARILETLGANPVAPDGLDAPSLRVGAAGPGAAYLRISDGCSHGCTFCSIPQMRGLYHSEPLAELLAEARRLVDGGVKEIILIGQETTSYGVDLYGERRLVELCRRLGELSGLRWIRLLYAHPPSTSPRLLEELAAIPQFVPYLDFPVEHASDRILKLMGRKCTAARMKDTIAAFRAARPGACVRTSLIAGFPGETDEDFEQLLCFLQEVRFERAGAFLFSPQDGTAAAGLPGRVEEGVALHRLERCMTLQRQICLEKHRALEGAVMDVLIERTVRGASWGRSYWDAPEIDGRVRVTADVAPGEIVPVRITRGHTYRLDGRLAEGFWDRSRREPCGKHSLPVLPSRQA
jgi:ribosomal protein S12 methylthiotransferase